MWYTNLKIIQSINMQSKKQHDFTFEPQWLVVIVFFFAGIFIGGFSVFTWITQTGGPRVIKKIHPASQEYTFINPLLGIEISKRKEFLENKVIEKTMGDALEQDKKAGTISNYSIYFRELETGLWTGINETKKITVGKIFPLPLMIAYLKQAESDPTLLSKTIRSNQNFPQEDTQKDQTIEELIKKMINENDTQAAEMLYNAIDKDALANVTSELGIDFQEDTHNENYISLKSYALIYRFLYNATYLNQEMSEKALRLLHTNNQMGDINTNLPKSILTAHSYQNTSILTAQDSLYESNDCGIVYYPEHPYLLCIALTHSNPSTAHTVLEDMGSLLYNTLTSKYHL